MNRFAKKFRVFAGLCILLNLVALFIPVTRRVQENYTDITWNQIDYIQSALSKYIPFLGKNTNELTNGQAGWILLFMMLPLILALISGVWGIIGSHSQKISSVLILLVLLLYIGMVTTIGNLWPEAAEGQIYCRGTACTWNLICSGIGAILSVSALAVTPKRVSIASGNIPQVEEIKQQQVEAKYNIMMEEKKENRTEPEHGVLVGLTDIYAGAEIPLTDGDYILLGRMASNHLVFEGQKTVSRNHCRIKWDEKRKKYIFRDYSCNGSFANGSEDCLPQNLDLELDPGTTISLGDGSNTFRLK